ncbi:NAD(P)-dependent alcohol dehydrogenase [Neobacillus sp. SCS-31]|uniref:NAD(P)-dependent alcohol dehydrogenase n=1 Tax=Neobacillus oceani TaxID=3115292 RepID=UPI0039060E8A
MNIQTALVEEKGDIQLENVQIAEPKSDEVLVRMVGTGICHTDLSVSEQEITTPLPIALGHEGAGVVEKVGPGVTDFNVGDHVVIGFTFCGTCSACKQGKQGSCENIGPLNFGGTMKDGTTRLSHEDKEVATLFGQSSLATYSIAHVDSLVKVDKDVDLTILGPLACGIQTGAGTILNVLNPEEGSTIAVFGCGGVGLSGIMAAKLSNCETIIAVDIDEERLVLAKELGATHTLNGKEVDVVSEIHKITGKGAQYAFEATGVPALVLQSIKSLAVGGTVAVVGVGGEASIHIHDDLVAPNRTVVGATEGHSNPPVFIPQLINYYKEGKFPFDKFIKKYPFEQIETAIADMKSGKTIKPVVTFE